VTKPGKNADMAAVEILLRNALLLSKQPAVHFVKMSVERGGQSAFLNQWFRAGGELADYNQFSILGFDNFGAPFDHLRRKMPKSRTKKDGKGSCSGNNVNDCPVDVNKQDGYHHDPMDVGYPLAEIPLYKKYAEEAGVHR
jgi:hypothetical protein